MHRQAVRVGHGVADTHTVSNPGSQVARGSDVDDLPIAHERERRSQVGPEVLSYRVTFVLLTVLGASAWSYCT